MSRDNIIGYVDPLITSPGAKPAVKVSCSRRDTFTSQVYRLGAGFNHSDGPPVSHRPLEAIPQQTHQGRPQFSRIGSFAKIPSWGGILLERADSVSISFWCQPTLPQGAKHDQFLFSSTDNSQQTGFECFLDQAGVLRLRTGVPNGMQEVILSVNLLRYRWYHLLFSMRSSSGTLTLKSKAKARDIAEPEELFEERHSLEQPLRIASHVPLTIGSDSHGCRPSSKPIYSGSFNGKIEGFRIETRSSAGHIDTLLDMDFSLDIPTDKIRDVSGNEHHGELINGPSRAVTGHDWHASQTDWTHASYGYGAIYFHDDDLDDTQWETTFELDVPKDLHSGCYGILVDDGVSTDFIPFFIRPDPNASRTPPVALIIPTMTYAGKVVPAFIACAI
ncbi:MAG: hypothetical protein Q9198_009399 [Flavoplaca austrocitrina]